MIFLKPTTLAFLLLLTLALGFFTGCETTSVFSPIEQAKRNAMLAAIPQEPLGNYYIGRRFYKREYKIWGWVRKPRQPWSQAQLVMLNEQQKLTPDRERNQIGSDNDYEYKLFGFFSGDRVYEPSSNRIYPEFVLKGYEVLSTNPPRIFSDPRSTDPKIRLLAPPM
ncbi:MAG: hypothetical protein ACK5LK_10010 [Chthoniobacterales bacterium]